MRQIYAETFAVHINRCDSNWCSRVCKCLRYIRIYIYIWLPYIYIYMIPVRGSLPPLPMVWSQNLRKRGICSVFCTAGGWRGPQSCKFVGFLRPAFRKRVICNVSAARSWSSAVAPPSMSNGHIILNLLRERCLPLKVCSLGNRSEICLYLIPVKLSLRVTSFPYLI